MLTQILLNRTGETIRFKAFLHTADDSSTPV